MNSVSETTQDRIRNEIARDRREIDMKELRELGRLENAEVDDDVISELQSASTTLASMMLRIQDLLADGSVDLDAIDLETLAKLAREARLHVVGAYSHFQGYRHDAARKEAARVEREGATEAAATKAAPPKRSKKTARAAKEARS